MERHILIAGRRSILLEALVREALSLDVKLLVTIESNQEPPVIPDEQRDRVSYVVWNRRSPLSARSVLIRATNFMGSVTDAFVVYSSEDKFRPFHELSPAEIETKIDADVKGYLFLLKEILAHLSREQQGAMSFVHQRPRDGLGSPLEAASAAVFTSIGDELFVAYQNEPMLLRGFESSSGSVQEFCQFVLTGAEDRKERTRGKWLRYTGKSGLFSFVR